MRRPNTRPLAGLFLLLSLLLAGASPAAPARPGDPAPRARDLARRLRFEARELGDDPVARALEVLLDEGYAPRLLELAADLAPPAEPVARVAALPDPMPRVARLADAFMKRRYPGMPRVRLRVYRRAATPAHLWYADYEVDRKPAMDRTVEVDLRDGSCREVDAALG